MTEKAAHRRNSTPHAEHQSKRTPRGTDGGDVRIPGGKSAAEVRSNVVQTPAEAEGTDRLPGRKLQLQLAPQVQEVAPHAQTAALADHTSPPRVDSSKGPKAVE